MGWLFIDTHALRRLRVAWVGEKKIQERLQEGRVGGLLPIIESLIKKTGLPTGIAVVKGPGTFSSIRIGVLVANLLARLWRKPLVALTIKEGEDLSALAKRLAQEVSPGVSYIAPEYDAEPNITFPKK